MSDKTCNRCKVRKPFGEFSVDRPEVTRRELEIRREWYYQKGGKRIVQANSKIYRSKYGNRRYPDPEAQKARHAVQSAVRRGRLLRSSCETCGSIPTQAHHDDYTKPLNVRWLCQSCHTEWHMHNEPVRKTIREGRADG